jgi:hypothetical protein
MSTVEGQKSQGRHLDTKGVGGCRVLDASTFDLRVLTFLAGQSRFVAFQRRTYGQAEQEGKGKKIPVYVCKCNKIKHLTKN